ncbi:MAG: hypothetical protein QXW25_00375 [Thermoplasmata archaeon]
MNLKVPISILKKDIRLSREGLEYYREKNRKIIKRRYCQEGDLSREGYYFKRGVGRRNIIKGGVGIYQERCIIKRGVRGG